MATFKFIIYLNQIANLYVLKYTVLEYIYIYIYIYIYYSNTFINVIIILLYFRHHSLINVLFNVWYNPYLYYT